MHMIKLYGKPIKANKASQDKRTQEVGANLFIGNLGQDVDEKLLYETFSNFGMIISTKITRDVEDGSSKGYGFISFDNFESADNTIAQMNGQYLAGKQITVQYAVRQDSKGEKHGSFAERLLAANKPMTSKIPILNFKPPAALVETSASVKPSLSALSALKSIPLPKLPLPPLPVPKP